MVSPNIELKEVTVREVYDAMVKNGPEWLRGTWFTVNSFDPNGPKVIGACIMGQAANNLDVLAQSDYLKPDAPSVGKYDLYHQLNKLRVLKSNKWAQPDAYGKTQGAADTIMYWNDEQATDDSLFAHYKGGEHCIKNGIDSPHYDCDGFYPYLLGTYEEVLQVAYDVLERHFDKVLKIAVINPQLNIINN